VHCKSIEAVVTLCYRDSVAIDGLWLPSVTASGHLSGGWMSDFIDSLGDHPTLFSAQDEKIVFAAGELVADRFEVIEAIGGGGMGIVYKVRDRLMNGEVKALKVILPSLTRSEKAQQRFVEEARIAQKLAHPNIVNTYDLGEHQGVRFITMEHLEGRSLADILREHGKLPLQYTIDLLVQVLKGLDYAHRTTVHRDLKPQNIFVTNDGRVKLLDFGLARIIGSSRFTQSSAVVGTAIYMAPEQLQGQPASPQSDLYAVGVILYQCLTGNFPIGRFLLPSETEFSIPPGVDNVLLSLLDGSAERRPENARETAKLLNAVSTVRKKSKSRVAIPAVSLDSALPSYIKTFWLDMLFAARKTLALRSRPAVKVALAGLAILSVSAYLYSVLGPPKAGEVRLFEGIEMVWCPGGEYLADADYVGSDAVGDQGNGTLARGFWIGRYEISKGQWEEVMGSTPWSGRGGYWDYRTESDTPAVYLSRQDCQEFIDRLNERRKGSFRLPTEEEWEYAARVPRAVQEEVHSPTNRSSVSVVEWEPAGMAQIGGNRPGEGVQNLWGIYNLNDAIWEWCADAYSHGTASSENETPSATLRGTLFDARQNLPVDRRDLEVGFRVLRDP